MSSISSVPKTTRICIKNVPPTFDDAKLRRHILESGPPSSSADLTITDCRILKTKEGKSRKLAFVGFKTHEQAVRAVEAFHGTYAKTSRLAVELAFSKKASAEETGHRPWSKHSKGSSRYERTHAKQEDEKDDDESADKRKAGKKKVRKVSEEMTDEKNGKSAAEEELLRKKEEFLQLMGASSAASGGGKAKAWANDDVGVIDASNEKVHAKESNADTHSDGTDDDEDDSADSDDNDSAPDDSSVDSGGEGADALAGSRGAYAGAAVSDMDFLRSKTTAKDELSEDDDDDEDEDMMKDNEHAETQPNDGVDESAAGSESSSSSSSDSSGSSSSSSDDDSDSDEEESGAKDTSAPEKPNQDIQSSLENGNNAEEDGDCARDRLFVRNLPFAATEEEVKEAFEEYGEVVECHIPVDDTKRNKGYAFVRFAYSNDALTARNALDGSDFQGRLMHVIPARRSREEDGGGVGDGTGLGAGNGGDMTYKKKQELARQKGAENVTAGWSSSFVRGDAVVDNLSDRLGLSKGDILNVKDDLSSGNAAVRLALGETQIIEENREYFEHHGIDMNILVSGSSGKGVERLHDVKRSKEMILVKNLPYDTTEDDLAKLFNGVGDAPSRILLPPSRTIAMVEYGHAVDARKAFRKLAYKRFKHVPLYLEWAPLAAKQSGGDTKEAQSNEANENNEQNEQAGDDEEDHTAASTLYCKNLNFSTTEEQLLEAFKRAGHKARAVRIPTKLAPVKKKVSRTLPGAEAEMMQLSMGFGFVEFDSDAAARKALKKMQGTFVDGHSLEIKFSGKGAAASSATKKNVTAPSSGGLKSKKLMVRNVPFQATRKEILQLFGAYGQLKKVRLPKKFDGSHRGFAFVEFLTSQEAQNAMKSLSSTHLYGRHLVLEWADDKEDIDALRDRAKRDASHVGAATKTTSQVPQNKKIRFDYD